MIYAIYKMTQKAIDEEMDWEEVFDKSEYEIVEKFETLEDAEKAWDSGWYDEDTYGVGGIRRTTYIY